jgi:hypothetical protein
VCAKSFVVVPSRGITGRVLTGKLRFSMLSKDFLKKFILECPSTFQILESPSTLADTNHVITRFFRGQRMIGSRMVR